MYDLKRIFVMSIRINEKNVLEKVFADFAFIFAPMGVPNARSNYTIKIFLKFFRETLLILPVNGF